METSFTQKFFSFSGRLNRLAYFLRYLVSLAIFLVVLFVCAFLIAALGPLGMIFSIPIIVVCVVFIVVSISLTVRRLHDMNFSGWWYLVILGLGLISGGVEGVQGNPSAISMIINLISLVISLVILFYPGTKGPNRFGADPLGRDAEYVDNVFGDSASSRFYNNKPQNDTEYIVNAPPKNDDSSKNL